MQRGIVSCATAVAAMAPLCLLLAAHLDFADAPVAWLGVRALPAVSAGETEPEAEPKRYPVIIRHPTTLGVLDTELRDVLGTPIGVACATCHADGGRPALAAREQAPKDFHADVELAHGTLSCNSCHHPADRTRLRLADGTPLAAGEVMQLCGQCHGPQLRDYRRGSHGGMAGYWDRTRGPQLRNSCETCHAAHEPAYPTVIPAAPPRDRFLLHHPEPRAARRLPGGEERERESEHE